MSISAKGIQLFLWRIIKFSGICCYKFLRKFPDISGVLIFVLCLYIFSPRVFLYFMYTSPVFVGAAVYIRFCLKTKYAESKKDGGERLSAGGKIVNASNEPSLRPQKSVRRNARKEVLEWHGERSLSSKTNLLEENSKVSFDRKGSSSVEHEEGCPHDESGNDQALDRNLAFDNETLNPHRVSGDDGGGELEVKSLEEVDGIGNNKAAQDDKKNRMDPGPGLAATERYKRLESLIAKRRAKKLFRMAIEKSLKGLHNVPPSQLGPILMAKINDEVSSNLDGEELQIPGSAPSFKQDSFDLPYGPQEEKPNLMADSFQQEFMPAIQKEMLFSRHESFCRGPWSQLATIRNPNYADFNSYYDAEKRLVEGKPVEESNHKEAMNLSDEEKEKIIETSNNRIETEGENIENPHDQEPGFDSGSEVRMDTDSIKNNDSCYSSSSENTEHVLDQTIKPPGTCNDHVQRALKLTIPRKGRGTYKPSFDSIPSPYRRPCHTPTYSVASDLQVEVSEVGSPPLVTDGTASSVDGDSIIYDGDAERDINSESEELWGGSFNLSREEANRERLRELDHIIEEEPIGVASTSPSEHEAKKTLNSQPSKYIEQHTRTLSEHNTSDALNAVQSKSNAKSIPDITVDQSAAEDNILNRRLRDSIARAVNRRLMLEQFSISSSLSPRSPVPQIIPADQVPISEQRMQDLPRSVRENMVRNNLAYEQAHENSNTPQISHESVENSLDRSSDNFSLGELKALKKVIEKGNKNINTSEDQSVFLMRSEDISGHGKSNEREADMNETEAIEHDYTIIVESAKERENSAAEVDRICKVDKSVADNKTNKEIKNDVLEREGALRILGKLKAVIEPSNTTGETSAGSMEETEHEFKRLVETEANPGLTTSAGETSCLNNIKIDEKMQHTTRQGVVDASRSGEFQEENLKVIESILKVDNIACISTSAGETNSLNNVKNDEKMQNTTSQEGADASQSGEVREENLKVIESILNVDNIACLSTSACETNSLNDIKNDEKMQNMMSQEGADASQSGEVREENLKVIESNLNVDNIACLSTSAGETNSLNDIKNDEKMQNTTSQEGADASRSGEVREENLKVIESILNVDNIAGLSTSAGETNSLNDIKNDEKMQNMTSEEGADASHSGEVREDNLKVIESILNVDNISGLSTSAGEANSLNDIKNDEKMQNMTSQEGADASQSGEVQEDNLKVIERILNVDNIACLSTSAGETNTLNDIKNDEKMQNMTSQEGTDASQSGEVREDNLKVIESILNVDNIAGLSTSAGETNSLNHIKNDEKRQNTTSQEGADASQSGEVREDNLKVDNIGKVLSIDHEGVQASKPTECEVKAAELMKFDTGIDPSKSEKEKPKSDDTETMNSAVEVDRICKVNESASDNVIDKETKTDVLKREDALQILDKLEAVMESTTTTTGESSLGSVEDIEHESKTLSEADADTTRQEGITDASQSGEDNLKSIDIISNVDNVTKGTFIDRDIDVEASNPTESEFKAIESEQYLNQ